MAEIVVYTGPMFSRKTAFLLAEYERSMNMSHCVAIVGQRG